MPPERERSRAWELPAEEVRTAAAEAVEAWGGSWDASGDGAIALPVQAGLRHGLLEGRLDVLPTGGGCRILLRTDRVSWRLHRPATVILALAGAAAGSTLLWPFVPELIGLLPVVVLLGIGAWFLVVTRLRNRGEDELLDFVAALAAEPRNAPPSPSVTVNDGSLQGASGFDEEHRG